MYMIKSFENVLNDSVNNNSTSDSKLMLVLTYLESHCPDKLEHFEKFLKAIKESEQSKLSLNF